MTIKDIPVILDKMDMKGEYTIVNKNNKNSPPQLLKILLNTITPIQLSDMYHKQKPHHLLTKK